MKLIKSSIYYFKLKDIFNEKSFSLYQDYNGLTDSKLNNLRLSIDPYGLVQIDDYGNSGIVIKTPAWNKQTAFDNIKDIVKSICGELNLTNSDTIMNNLDSAKMYQLNKNEWSSTL